MTLKINKMDIEKKTLSIRQGNNIQTYGVKDIFSLVEQRGTNLIRYPFGKDTILGFSTIFEGKEIIVSNSSEALSMEIFTIAHGLGHIIYDFKDENQDMKIDINIDDIDEDISEGRAYYFANCFLMPETQLLEFVKYELKKKPMDLNTIDIIRLQIEFQVSYAAVVKRLYNIGFINYDKKCELFNEKNDITYRALFKMINADEKLLVPSNVIKIPSRYLEYAITNYENNYIPYPSLKNALALLDIDASIFKKDENSKDKKLNINDIFEDYK